MKKIFSIFLIALTISINPVFALEWHNIDTLPENEKNYVKQTKTFSQFHYDKYNTFEYADMGSNFTRYKVFYNAEIDRCGLYDEKKDNFTGYKYKCTIKFEKQLLSDAKYIRLDETSKDNEIIWNTFSGVPIVIENGKRKSIQPFKRIGNSTVRGLYYAVIGIIILPFAIPYAIVWRTLGYDEPSNITDEELKEIMEKSDKRNESNK